MTLKDLITVTREANDIVIFRPHLTLAEAVDRQEESVAPNTTISDIGNRLAATLLAGQQQEVWGVAGRSVEGTIQWFGSKEVAEQKGRELAERQK